MEKVLHASYDDAGAGSRTVETLSRYGMLTDEISLIVRGAAEDTGRAKSLLELTQHEGLTAHAV
jgi:hypothetical protein